MKSIEELAYEAGMNVTSVALQQYSDKDLLEIMSILTDVDCKMKAMAMMFVLDDARISLIIGAACATIGTCLMKREMEREKHGRDS